jgi:DNA polymerase-3 subunit beta
MKFIVTRSVLLDALTVTAKAINSKNIMPILENYLFDIKNNDLEITGSNMEIFISTKIEIAGEEFSRKICLPATRLFNLVKDLPEQPITFEFTERMIQKVVGSVLKDVPAVFINISAGSGKYLLPTEDGEDFPEIRHKSEITFDIKCDDLIKGIEKTLFTTDNTMPGSSFCGVLVSFEGKQVTYTGTNSHILSTYSLESDVETNKSFIVPPKVLSVLQGLPKDEKLNISLNDKNIIVRFNEVSLLKAVLVDGRYPDYKAVIPADQPFKLCVNRFELIGALKRVTNFSNQITHSVVFELKANNPLIDLRGENTDLQEEARENLTGEYQGDDLTIGCNGRFLLSMLSKLDNEEIYFGFTSKNKAIVIRDFKQDQPDKSNLMLIMPVMV